MSFKNIAVFFLSYGYILFIGLSSAVFFLIALIVFLLTFFFDRRRIILSLFSSFWASVYIWCMPAWSVNIIGRQKMDMKKSYVIVSNHQSQLDILVAFYLFFPFRWVSKAEVFLLPFIGWNMILNGHVKLKRGDKHSIKKMIAQCEDLLSKNISVIIFPEGTRSKTGILKPFKPGAFILAKKMKKPILPLVINNTKNALPKHSLRIQGRHHIEVKVLDEIPYTVFEHMEIEHISDMVRARIAAHVQEHMALDTFSGSRTL
ncbi:MAG: 1-acyl-sn-glycerol-3-phosphate acyltransferase [Proteobacteria bacterium]|nr:1-acyl-sn-glycerol-3-phosphate acyltransferase [Pseudomonadota bacterium]MBU1388771.1 1-acyl-sn-glycerol-3-phosphate acyltransferase [Pseudomonadota bacterium]MBU1543112.1 1-acyl-sn-glycerol-3-phosphate acyltransferase [Pseudomonadota bacterium]MBU2483160.1 1-acyl-sn-glycerol-3-phosphate acyltransferase [Pseudomonadota bacterium]